MVRRAPRRRHQDRPTSAEAAAAEARLARPVDARADGDDGDDDATTIRARASGERGAAPPRPRRAHRSPSASTCAGCSRCCGPTRRRRPVAAPAPGPPRRAPTRGRTLRAALRNGGEVRAPAAPRPRPGGRARSCCWSTSPARWSPTPTRCCASRTSSRGAPPRPSRRSPSAPGSPGSPASCGMRDADHALHAAGKAIPDWSGGTRLGEVLRAFVDRWGQRGVARRAVVVVFSDGWERGEPDLLGEQMARLAPAGPQDRLGEPARRQGRLRAGAGRNRRRRCRTLTDLLAGHSLATLEELLRGDARCVTCSTSSRAGGRTGRPAALATVVGTFRSAPRQPGASMLVGPDGRGRRQRVGRLRRGRGVRARRSRCSRDGRPVLQRYGVSDDDAFAVGPDLRRHPRHLRREGRPRDLRRSSAAVAEAVRDASGRSPSPRSSSGPAERLGQRLVVWPDRGRRQHRLGPARRRRRATTPAACSTPGATRMVTYGTDGERRGEGLAVFVESFAPPPRMIVFGAIDFAAAVRPDRHLPRLSGSRCATRARCSRRRSRFPEAHEVVVEWPHRYLAAEAEAGRIDERTVLVRAHPRPEVRRAAARGGAAAARGRPTSGRWARGAPTTTGWSGCASAGVTEAELARMSRPIGLDLGARTPEETAVSIAAEMIAQHWGGGGHAGSPSARARSTRPTEPRIVPRRSPPRPPTPLTGGGTSPAGRSGAASGR